MNHARGFRYTIKDLVRFEQGLKFFKTAAIKVNSSLFNSDSCGSPLTYTFRSSVFGGTTISLVLINPFTPDGKGVQKYANKSFHISASINKFSQIFSCEFKECIGHNACSQGKLKIINSRISNLVKRIKNSAPIDISKAG